MKKIHTDTASAVPHSAQNTPRQPSVGSAHSTGAVASTLPSVENAIAMPVMPATFAGANHSVLPLMIAISPAEIPTPRITRATMKPVIPEDSANSAKPAAATSISPVCIRLGPITSSATPSGSCTTA